METSALDTYVAAIDARWAPIVREMDRLVVEAAPDLEVALKYRILVYTYHQRWHEWVCAISTAKASVSLRFLFGTRLDAPPGRLRPGSTTAASLDVRSIDELDRDLVRDLVRQAVAHQATRDAESGGSAG